jgi:Mrp family chromosome partitioning ATPase
MDAWRTLTDEEPWAGEPVVRSTTPSPGAAPPRGGGGGIEAIRMAFWRSRWLILGVVLVGIALANVRAQLAGPQYEASSTVLISDRDLGASLTGSSAYVDPQRVQDTELALAQSAELFRYVANTTGRGLGGYGEIAGAVSVSGDSKDNILTFTAATADPTRAVRLAAAVAEGFTAWRANIAARPVRSAIAQVEQRIRTGGRTPELARNLETLRVLDTLNSGNAQVIQTPTGASQTRPAPVRDSLFGLGVGLLVGLVITGSRELFNITVRSEEDAEELLGLSVLGEIPAYPRGARNVLFGRFRRTYEDVYSLLAAEVEQRRRGKVPTTLAVSSPSPREGKSSTSANLAVTLARRGSHVLLVDLDLRRPSVHQLFGIPPAATGTRDVIFGRGRVAPSFWAVQLDQPGAHPRVMPLVEPPSSVGSEGGSLSLLPAGSARTGTGNPRPEDLHRLLSELHQSFDWVIVDTPPALRTAQMADLASAVDAVVIVVREGRTTRRSLRALSRQMSSWSTTPLGAVFIGVQRSRGYYSYHERG